MPSTPPFYEQETPDSCVPACLRMVLGSFGVDLSESELRTRCDCTPYFGTAALMVVDVARKLGFPNTAKHTLTLEELRVACTNGRYPIVFIDLSPIDGTPNVHALVVVGASEQQVVVLDPLTGERSISFQAFTAGWAMRRNLAIIVEP